MKIQLEASEEQLNELIALANTHPLLADLKPQLEAAIAMAKHQPIDEVPKEGDHPVIDRFE